MKARIEIHENIFGANEKIARENRALFDHWGVFTINLMASPGAGKTSLIEVTIKKLVSEISMAVIDGDIASHIDADRATAAGAYAIQINTGGNCHLDALMLSEVITKDDFSKFDLLLVENVGNLVCPASFSLGTHKSVLIASIPEGDDKPYKYPGMYRGVDALVINKIDLLPYIPFKMDYFQTGVEALNPGLVTFTLSCQSGEGLEKWVDWIRSHISSKNI